MKFVPPKDLSDLQWLLILYLHQQGPVFYKETVFEQLSSCYPTRSDFNKVFYRLVIYNYVQWDGNCQIPDGRLQRFGYKLTPKAIRLIKDSHFNRNATLVGQQIEKVPLRAKIIKYLPRTIQLVDFALPND